MTDPTIQEPLFLNIIKNRVELVDIDVGECILISKAYLRLLWLLLQQTTQIGTPSKANQKVSIRIPVIWLLGVRGLLKQTTTPLIPSQPATVS